MAKDARQGTFRRSEHENRALWQLGDASLIRAPGGPGFLRPQDRAASEPRRSLRPAGPGHNRREHFSGQGRRRSPTRHHDDHREETAPHCWPSSEIGPVIRDHDPGDVDIWPVLTQFGLTDVVLREPDIAGKRRRIPARPSGPAAPAGGTGCPGVQRAGSPPPRTQTPNTSGEQWVDSR